MSKAKEIKKSKCCGECSQAGKVYLIGAGPGDPELISVKGKRIIAEADCIVYDFLASKEIIGESDAEMIYVGKSGRMHTMEQADINRLLVKKAKEGKTVARLKGGDVFIFGRGGEEALELYKNDIKFEIIPGVSSAYAAPAYAGIPVTQRGMTSTLAFITGHEDPTKKQSDIDWAKISTGIGTLVFLMGVKNLPNIAEKLMENGRSPETGVALVRWGTTARQEVVTGKLKDIAEKVKKAGFKSPAIIIVGEVVSLRKELAWFDNKPLFGKTFIVTRTREQASALSRCLRNKGAEVIEVATIKITEPDSYESLEGAVKKLVKNTYDMVIFTSPNGVDRFFDFLHARDLDSRLLAGTQITVMGPATALALHKYGLKADRLPREYKAEGIIEELKDLKGKKVLIARAKEARDILPETLSRENKVDIAVTYQTVIPPESRTLLNKTLEEENVEMVTFTSSSTVENFAELLDDTQKAKSLKFASIGPITSETARRLGFDIDTEAEQYTIEGLITAIMGFYTTKEKKQ